MRELRGSKPIWDAYADANMADPCSNCGAAANTWCRRDDGRLRRVPCLARTKTPTTERTTP